MASIYMRNDKFRAVIRRRGYPTVSKSFDTREEAEAWAANIEVWTVAGKSVPPELLPDMHRCSRRRLHRGVLTLTKANILKFATPYPVIGGVYFLIKDKEIIYVGMTIHILRRIAEHERDGKVFDWYHYIECDQDTAKQLEETYIRELNPPLNTEHTPRGVRRRSRNCTAPSGGAEESSGCNDDSSPLLGTNG